MSRWLTYTAAPKPDLSLQEFTTRVGEELWRLPDEVADDLEPLGYREHGVVSERISNSSAIGADDIQRWFQYVHDEIRVLYLTRVSDTSDSVMIDVYEPTVSGKLGLVEERSGDLLFEESEEYDDRFDERAAAVRELEDPRMGTYSDEDHLRDLRFEYGARPLFHYK